MSGAVQRAGVTRWPGYGLKTWMKDDMCVLKDWCHKKILVWTKDVDDECQVLFK